MKRKCININTKTEYYLLSKHLIDQDGTGFDYLLQLIEPSDNIEYMWCSNTYFDENFKLYEIDYKKIKSSFADNEELLKQCTTFACPGRILISNFSGFWCMGLNCRTWDLDVYRDCEFNPDIIYMVTVYPKTGKVVDIYE